MQDNSGMLEIYRLRILDLETRAQELRTTDGKQSDQLEGEAHALRLSLPDIMRSVSPEASEAEELAEQKRYEDEQERELEECYWEEQQQVYWAEREEEEGDNAENDEELDTVEPEPYPPSPERATTSTDMSEEKIDWNYSSLTKPSLADYEKAIAKAISELTGEKYAVSISSFDRTPKWAGGIGVLGGNAELVLRVSRDRD